MQQFDQGQNRLAITQELQKLAPDTQIELFVLDLTELGAGLFHFHAGTNQLSSAIMWQGVEYAPMPIQAEGFAYQGQGTQPRPRLRVANLTKLFSGFLLAYQDLVGARLIRKRTFAKYLDGSPTADPTAEFPDEIWVIDRKATENRMLVEWELASPLDTEGIQIPGRIIVAACPWEYRKDGCGYTGTTYFKSDDTPTANVAEDRCGKKPASCRLRFGKELPFGGFPAVKGY